MIKRELKVNFKSFILWTVILVGIFTFTYSIYPFIINDESIKSLDEMMSTFPPELIKAFNMDMASLTSAYGWFLSEGYMFIQILVGLYASILGSGIVLKEEGDKTIEYLASLPITRNKIMTNKIIVSIIYIVSMLVVFGIFNFVALSLSGKFDNKQFLLLSVVPLLAALPLYAINLFISMFFHKNKKMIGISLGVVFIFYIISIVSELSKSVEFLKYFTVYTLTDARNIMSKVEFNPIMIVISLAITVLFIALSYIKYNKKELI